MVLRPGIKSLGDIGKTQLETFGSPVGLAHPGLGAHSLLMREFGAKQAGKALSVQRLLLNSVGFKEGRGDPVLGYYYPKSQYHLSVIGLLCKICRRFTFKCENLKNVRSLKSPTFQMFSI